jgi:hypothetical protein
MEEDVASDDQIDIPEGMRRIFIGLPKKGPAWSPEVTPKVTENQHAHLDLLSQLGSKGDLLMAGPTPVSKTEKPRVYSPGNILGKIAGDVSSLRDVPHGTTVKLSKADD